jgi:YHS domain-containing protein
MKYLLTSIAVLLITVAAFADGKDKEIKCAVQGWKISIAQATKDHMFADYKGRRYFFCCSGCPEEFKANPAKFAPKAESIPSPKVAKKSTSSKRH